MRWVNTAIMAIIIIATLIFAFQNFQNVTVTFLNFKITAPHALLIAFIYLLGMVTGGGVMGTDTPRIRRGEISSLKLRGNPAAGRFQG
jgi:lipopolysaccharide assembly protein A